MKHIFLTLLVCFLMTSCVGGGGKGVLSFEDAMYPVSTSRGTFLDKSGKLAKKADYEVVGSFEADFSAGSFFWGFSGSEEHINLGPEVNDQVKRAGGDAIQNLEISVRTSPIGHFPVLSLLPFWPSYAVGEAKGDILRYKRNV